MTCGIIGDPQQHLGAGTFVNLEGRGPFSTRFDPMSTIGLHAAHRAKPAQWQWRNHEVLAGGGRILIRQTNPPPKSDFCSDFGHCILKIVEKSENFGYIFFKKNRDFRGGRPPSYF